MGLSPLGDIWQRRGSERIPAVNRAATDLENILLIAALQIAALAFDRDAACASDRLRATIWRSTSADPPHPASTLAHLAHCARVETCPPADLIQRLRFVAELLICTMSADKRLARLTRHQLMSGREVPGCERPA
jgi:hypothetical protein